MIIEELYCFDDRYRTDYGDYICGIDEAGRGLLAGPVCCAAVILKRNSRFSWLNDSKKITEKRREVLFEQITSEAVTYSIVFVDNKKIDKMNILAATMSGMKEAAEGIEIDVPCFLVDGNKVPDGMKNAYPIIKGDAKSASIAAASVLAKVSRDRFMTELDFKYPEYGFAKHKGYATKLHYERIERFGSSEYHRMTFLGKLNND